MLTSAQILRNAKRAELRFELVSIGVRVNYNIEYYNDEFDIRFDTFQVRYFGMTNAYGVFTYAMQSAVPINTADLIAEAQQAQTACDYLNAKLAAKAGEQE